MLSVAVWASSSPFTNDVPSVQNVPDPTSAGIRSEASNAGRVGRLERLDEALLELGPLARVGARVPGEEPGEAAAHPLEL